VDKIKLVIEALISVETCFVETIGCARNKEIATGMLTARETYIVQQNRAERKELEGWDWQNKIRDD